MKATEGFRGMSLEKERKLVGKKKDGRFGKEFRDEDRSQEK
jgi:hypothetical protein